METSSSSSKTLFALNSDSKTLHLSARILTVLITLGAFVLSFNALSDLAVASGIMKELSWVWALCVDGFIIINTLAAFSLQNKGKSSVYAWSILILFVGFSIFGNAWHAVLATTDYKLPLAVSVIVTAIPPATLFLSIHLLILMVQPTKEQKAEIDRVRKREARLQAVEDKELERLEKEAIISSMRAKSPMKTTANAVPASPVPSGSRKRPRRQPQTPPARPGVAPAVQSALESGTSEGGTSQELTEPHSNPVQGEGFNISDTSQSGMENTSEGDFLSEDEVTAMLEDAYSAGESLPSGRMVADWLGKSERTGQNFVKKFKASKARELA